MNKLADKYLREGMVPTKACQGCAIGAIEMWLLQAIDELGLKKEDVIFGAGIGCVGRMTFATWGGDRNDGIMNSSLIVRGQANLLEDINALNDLEHIRNLFNTLETKQEMLKLLSLTDSAEGVQIFIGAENQLFSMASVSIVVDSFKNNSEQVLGAIGVIGPTRMNYARIIPMVDYTAKLIGRIIG